MLAGQQALTFSQIIIAPRAVDIVPPVLVISFAFVLGLCIELRNLLHFQQPNKQVSTPFN